MSILVKIESEAVREKKISFDDGGTKTIRSQIGWAFLLGEDGKPNPYPQKVEIGLEEQSPYPVGEYMVSPLSFYVGKYDKLAIGRLRLMPVPKKAAA